MTTPLRREDGGSDGVVIVFDDVTPLIRAQKVAAWREVARRLAHEIKNPLTPIQLCAERIRRHLSAAPEPTRALVEECTTTIVGEVESLEGAGRRVLAVRADAGAARRADRPARAADRRARRSIRASSRTSRSGRRFAAGAAESVRRSRADPPRHDQSRSTTPSRRWSGAGSIEIETQHDPANNLVRIVVADDGPGIPAAERDKLFLPYYSTKRRGSGLGLAIVRRIVAEHGGSIDVTDNMPRGTRFAVELPVEWRFTLLFSFSVRVHVHVRFGA